MEKLGRKLKFTFDHKNFHSVSLGQGQEVVAEEALEVAAKHGHWVILQVRGGGREGGREGERESRQTWRLSRLNKYIVTTVYQLDLTSIPCLSIFIMLQGSVTRCRL